MDLVRDLLMNRYLITPSAYFLLQDRYKRDFMLSELIKFARTRGTFVIDNALAEEFLKSKGLIAEKPPLLESIEKSVVVEGALEARAAEEDTVSTGAVPVGGEYRTPVSSGTSPETSAAPPDSGEIPGLEFQNEAGQGYISTGTAPEKHLLSSSSVEIEAVEIPSNGGQSSVSTEAASGVRPIEVSQEAEIPESEASAQEFSSGNGDEDAPRVVYGEYGVLVPVEEEIIPEGEVKSYSTYSDLSIRPREDFEFRAKEIPDEYEIKFDVKNVKLKPPKAKNANGKEGEIIVQVYANYFRSRMKKMRKLLRENPEVSGVIDIAKLGYVAPEGEVAIIGLINSKRETRKGYMFEVEDGTGVIKVFIGRDKEDYRKVFDIVPDAVVAFKGYYSKKGILFANSIYLPDVPLYKRNKPPLDEKVYAVLLSDIHVGSNKFCEKAFIKFLEWLNGEVNSREEEEIVSRIKYIIIDGDVVDGVGIYPGQYSELVIPDVFDQYEALANLLANVPEHMTMFIGPGNHDAARMALPQPGFYKEYAHPILKLKNAVIISNPAVIDLHGREFLVYHGRGIEDIVSFIPNRSHHRPAEAMVNLLKLRHLAPTFGGKVPIAPDPEDLLVIESVPDLFHTGHVHVLQYQVYHGVFLVNSATWQAQTEFQKMVNIVPTPGKVPVIDIETARLKTVIDFGKWCEGV
ncbi:DNA-directed DNA polymerase II small subunit [Thermococcus sp.]